MERIGKIFLIFLILINCCLFLCARDVVVIAVHDAPPYYIGKDGGLNGEIYKSAFNEVNMDIELQYFPIKRGVEYLFANKVDAHSPGTMFITGDLQKKIKWVDISRIASIYYYYKPVHKVLKIPTTGMEERIGFIKKNNYSLGILNSNPVMASYKAAGLNIIENENTSSQVKMMKLGRFDIGVSDFFLASMQIARIFPKETNNFIFVDATPYNISLAFSLGNPKSADLLQKFGKGFDIIKKNGTFIKIMSRYWGKNNIPRKVLTEDMQKFGTANFDMRKVPIFNLEG